METIKIDWKNCHINSIHNEKLNKKYKMRAGSVLLKGEILEGIEKNDCSVREYYIPNGHSWVETSDGFIIDWVLNHIFETQDIKIFDKKRLEQIGITYIYHNNDKKIVSKIKRRYK